MRTSFIIVFLSVLLLSCSNDQDTVNTKGEIHVATAANMQFAMDSLGAVFEEDYGYKCNVTANSSGMLTAQIEKGAPYDVFISANMRYPNKLKQSGFGGEPEVYAYGRLVIVYPKEKKYSSIEELLKQPSIKRVAVANNKTAPYGMAADQYLNRKNLKKRFETKLITGESVGQVNQYLVSKSVDAAFTSYSFVSKYGDQYNYLEVPAEKFDEIEQGMLILKHGSKENKEASLKLLEFMRSSKGQAILSHFGYRVK